MLVRASREQDTKQIPVFQVQPKHPVKANWDGSESHIGPAWHQSLSRCSSVPGVSFFQKANQLKECFRLASTDTDNKLPRKFTPYRRRNGSRDLRSENQMMMYVVFISRWVENMAS